MKKEIGPYTVNLCTNTNFLVIRKDGMTIKGYEVEPMDSGSAFNDACEKIEKYYNNQK